MAGECRECKIEGELRVRPGIERELRKTRGEARRDGAGRDETPT